MYDFYFLFIFFFLLLLLLPLGKALKEDQETPRVTEITETRLKEMAGNLQKFLNSKVVRDLVENETEFSYDEEVPDTKEAIRMRNILVTYFIVINIRRSKELTEFTLGEFRRAELVQGFYLLRIKHHKTQRSGKY